MKNRKLLINKICLSSLFLVIGWLLPFATGQIPEIGNLLCPMHIPVLLCGFILGPFYGLVIGFITPLTRTLIFSMPALYPMSVCMAFELATYGFISGLLFNLFYKKTKMKLIINIIITLIIAMLTGRMVWGISRFLCGIISQSSFTFKLFMADAFINAWPGIILQLILIPSLLMALKKAKLLDKYLYKEETNE